MIIYSIKALNGLTKNPTAEGLYSPGFSSSFSPRRYSTLLFLLYRHGLKPQELTDLRDNVTALATIKALCRKTRAKIAPLLCERATTVTPHWIIEVFGWSRTPMLDISAAQSNL